MKYSIVLIVASLVVLFNGCRPAGQQPPNILFIMGDDHTSQAWGVYGSELDPVVHAPNIMRLSQEGALLMNCFCTNSICTPSRATILTGQYSHVDSVYTLADSLNPAHENVAKVFRKSGYQTAIVGKWHLKTKPAGFDYFNIFPGQGRYHNPVLKDTSNWASGGKEYEGFSTDVVTDQALGWLQKRDKDQPFMLMCHFKATHEPFDYAERFKDLYKDQVMPEPSSLLRFYPYNTTRTFPGQVLEILGQRYERNNSFYPGGPFSLAGLDSIAARKKIYQKFVKDFLRSSAGIDENIGRLLDYLDKNGLAKNTIVIYTADQGYFLGEHGFFDKRMMYEEALRMPFVIRYPKEIKPGLKLKDMVLNIDFAPTLLDFAGISKPAYMQGASFKDNLAGKTPSDWRRSMYYRYWLHLVRRPAHLGIRTDRYKLIFYYGQPLGMSGAEQQATDPTWEFYDLKEDPHELNNVYGNDRYQQTISQLKKQLLEQRQIWGDTDATHPVMSELIGKSWGLNK